MCLALAIQTGIVKKQGVYILNIRNNKRLQIRWKNVMYHQVIKNEDLGFIWCDVVTALYTLVSCYHPKWLQNKVNKKICFALHLLKAYFRRGYFNIY